ncbi:recQ-mediated genome instability protein 1-like isoform X2 [Toxorhynchites rutilus septentrionalis]|uniref:recQ-mediated genome instability protein 1-like isoform X2 n=1 Tax=Toxorhynchites rutilus septentrionalis TaxID=329112 RepID=UPI00247A54C6|nr:recQ-mediated genome instability protein 1-like isoform X2 [Toxorhynchites rutilus septentrionalis]
MIQSEENHSVQVKTRLLREYNIKVVEEWLTGCVAFCLQENPRTSNDTLFKFAFDQWILADLNEIGVSCLPETTQTEVKCFTLSGKFPVQLNFLIDISEPCYDQLRNLYNKKLDEADDEIQLRKNQNQHVKKRRMLKLEMTDGKRTVIGMEHTPIAALNTKLPPGVKILLIGPIRCINKVLFLGPKNVRILGGEVDTLLITHAFENVLLKALGQPLKSNPRTEYEEVVVVEKNQNHGYGSIPSIPMVFPSSDKNSGGKHGNEPPQDDWEDDVFLGINLDNIEASNGNKKLENSPEQVPTVSTLMDDDDDLEIIELPEEKIMDQQVTSTKISQSPPATRPVRPANRLPSYDGPDDDIDALNFLEEEIRNEQQTQHRVEYEGPTIPSTPQISAKRPRLLSTEEVTQVQHSTNVTEDDQRPSTSKNFVNCSISAFFDDSSLGDILEEVEDASSQAGRDDILSPNYQFQIEGFSLVTVPQLFKLSDAQREERTFVIFGEVEEVFQRIRVRNDAWKLGVMITDWSERFLPVQFHTSIISKMIGHEASSVQQLKQDRNPQMMKLLEENLKKLQHELQELRSFMRLRYHQGSEHPTVMEIYDKTSTRLTVLREKVSKEDVKHLPAFVAQLRDDARAEGCAVH